MKNISELHNGDLLYWKGKGFFPWLVRTWTRSTYAHVGVFFNNGQGGAYFESQPGLGVRMVSIAVDPPQACQITTCAWDTQITQKVINLEGRPYSYWTSIATILGIAGKGTSAYMCSELAMQILSFCGWDFKGAHYTPIGLSLAITRSNGEPIEELQL